MKIKGLSLKVRSVNRWLNASIAKIVYLKASGEDITFRRLFNPQSEKTYDKWFKDLVDKGKYPSYQKRLQKIAYDFKFEPSEMDTLEMYLLFGGGIVSGGGSTRLREEQKPGHFIVNSQWDTPFLYQNIKELRNKGWNYKKIVEYYSQIIKKHGFRHKVTTAKLRQVVSRGDKKVSSVLNRLM